MAINPLAVMMGLQIGGSLLGGKKGKKGRQDALSGLQDAWAQAQEQYQEYMNQALEALGEGKAEASDKILEGLGLSLEERTKFYDIAVENLDWIVDFGKARRGDYTESMRNSSEALQQSQGFLNHFETLMRNPDAIYGTKVYEGLKNQAMDEWKNFYGGRGIQGGNAQAALVDRISENAYQFLQGERANAARGVQLGQNQSNAWLQNASQYLNAIGLGANAASTQSGLYAALGDHNAGDIMNAYGQLGALEMAGSGADILMNAANFFGNGALTAGGAQANLGLAGALGQQNNLSSLGNSLAMLYGFNQMGGQTPQAGQLFSPISLSNTAPTTGLDLSNTGFGNGLYNLQMNPQEQQYMTTMSTYRNPWGV